MRPFFSFEYQKFTSEKISTHCDLQQFLRPLRIAVKKECIYAVCMSFVQDGICCDKHFAFNIEPSFSKSLLELRLKPKKLDHFLSHPKQYALKYCHILGKLNFQTFNASLQTL
jgi:hypothetical protein